jgi:hypothetical protein
VNDVVRTGRGADGRWLPGYSGNANLPGRPIGSRQRLAEQFIRDAYELCAERRGQQQSVCQLSPEEKRRLAGMLMDQLAAEKARVIEASSVPQNRWCRAASH